MATLRDSIKRKINLLVSQASVLTADYNTKQADIAAQIQDEEGRLQSMAVFLDQEVEDAINGLEKVLASYRVAAPVAVEVGPVAVDATADATAVKL